MGQKTLRRRAGADMSQGEAGKVVARGVGPKEVGKGPKEPREPGGRARGKQEARRGIGRPAEGRKGVGDEVRLWEA